MFGRILLLSVILGGTFGDYAERRLFNDLFTNYTVMERPIEDHTKPLLVYIKLTLQQIVDIDEKNQIMTTNAWINLKWHNYKMMWNPADYDDLNKTRIAYDHIWVPDILLYNSASDKFDSTTHTGVVVTNNGSCLWVPPGYFKSTCKIDVSNFPFDKQRCKLKFGIWTYTGDMVRRLGKPEMRSLVAIFLGCNITPNILKIIRLVPYNIYLVDLRLQESGGTDTTEYMPNGEWHLEEINANRTETIYKCCPDKYVDVTFEIVLQRRSMFYMVNLVFPCCLNSLLTLLTFLLPAQAGEKVTLSITVLLAQIVFMLLIMEAMPATSDAVPLISKYFSFSLAYVCLSVGATILVLSFHYHLPDMDGHMSPRMRYFFLEILPSILHQKRHHSGKYLSMEHPYSRLHCMCNPDEVINDREFRNANKYTGDYLMLHGLHHHTRFLAHKMANDERIGLAKLEWQYAARMLDKLFLWFFSILIVISTIVTLFAMPAIANNFTTFK